MRAEADVDVEESLDDSEYPVGQRALGTENDAEHPEYGSHGGYEGIDSKVTLDDKREDGQGEDGQ